MRIAIFDYLVRPDNPAGSCHRQMLKGLAQEHEFTVFATEFDNPQPGIIPWIRVPAVVRPLAALFVSFHISACIAYLRNRGLSRFAIVQSVESNISFGNVVYAHFCHRWFLRHCWRQCRPSGLRRLSRWLDHALHALLEPWALRRARWIIVPSSSSSRQLTAEYPRVGSKVRVIPNPVEVERYARLPGFDRNPVRKRLRVADDDVLAVFVSL